MRPSFHFHLVSIVAFMAVILSGCGFGDLPEVPKIPEMPDLPNIPGMPQSLDELSEQLPGILDELQLPDLSEIANLPDLTALPLTTTEPGAIVFQGPTEKQIRVGQRLPGTDIELVSVDDQGANFRIAGFNARRSVGDSLDFDGGWPGVEGITYTVRLRVYRVGTESVRAAGVHQMIVRNIDPVAGPAPQHDGYIMLPFTIAAGAGEQLKGLTLGYAGASDRGGELTGLSQDEYPFRKIGDSLEWEGSLRSDIPVRYSLRVLYYDADGIRVGGTVSLYLQGLE